MSESVVCISYVDADDDYAAKLDNKLRLLHFDMVDSSGAYGAPKTDTQSEVGQYYNIMLWSQASSNDIDFRLKALQAERRQVENQDVKNINVLLGPVTLAHIKQDYHMLPCYGDDWKEPEELGEVLAAVIRDPKNSSYPKLANRVGNISEGLVWNYFTVYLKTVLPKIKEKVAEKKEEMSPGTKFSDKYFLIVPNSGRTHGKLQVTQTNNYKNMGQLCELATNDSGIYQRKFTPSYHKIHCAEENVDYYFAGEYANPVNTIYQLSQHPYDIIGVDERTQFIEKFKRRLRYVLDHDNHGLRDTYEMVEYDDVHRQHGSLESRLLEFLKQHTA